MRWQGQRESDNVEDVRDEPGGGAGGGFGGLPIGGRGLSLGGVVVALIAGWIFGINPLTLLGLMDGGGPAPQAQREVAPSHPTDERARFASVVLADTEDVWGAIMGRSQRTYTPPRMVLFRGSTRTSCGLGEAAAGPFYCPADRKVYIDLSFFDVLTQRLGAPGDFAQAYVIAHEVGHHVQTELGLTQRVDAQRQRLPAAQANALSVRLELQADCFAGVWAHHSQRGKNWLEAGDIEEALNAASQIGDDTLQRRSRGTVVPESFTHGSSAQRVQWFKRGLQAGVPAQCNTFETAGS
jgi:predicted metalloprotease